MPDDYKASPRRTRLFAADPMDRQVASRLAARRRVLHLDSELIDLVLGFRAGTTARLETGESRIGPSHIFRLAAILDVDVEWFFADEADEHRPHRQRPTLQASPDDVAQARRFLAHFARLRDHTVRDEIRELVQALADRAAPPAGLVARAADLPIDVTAVPAPPEPERILPAAVVPSDGPAPDGPAKARQVTPTSAPARPPASRRRTA
ncbi:MAG: helix-turn-helix transcriptional regulator [Rhodospirillales bacterium]|nr:helix-turn-helix transcriptional regulator [Rhodospirillales bacterium]